MVDLHTHVLPGLDDGARTVEDSVALARAAGQVGTRVLVATPHVRDDYPFDPSRVRSDVERLNRQFAEMAVSVGVVPGGEVSITKVLDLDEAELAGVCLGDGTYMLIESPYTHTGELLEQALFEAQLKGFQPILAHPERSPCFLGDLHRLSRLVDRGILSSVTSGSMAGRFGGTVREYTARLFEAGLVHNVASDSHGVSSRAPGLLAGFNALEHELPGLREQAVWYTNDVPSAVIAGEAVPPRPAALAPRRRRRRWTLRGVGRRSSAPQVIW